MTVGIYLTALAGWLALGFALVLVRQLLVWIALRGLKPDILHRMTLPEGNRIREPMRLGIAYGFAKWAGWLGLAYLIAPVLHLLLLGFDQGWTVQLGIALAVFGVIAAAGFAFDRLLASAVRRAMSLPANWRARAL